MQEKKLELEVGPDGVIRTIYDDSLNKFAEDIGGEISTVCRLSNVEWEEIDGHKGWTVRAAHDRELALRYNPYPEVGAGREGRLIVFESRENALKWEHVFAPDLLPPRKEK